MAGDQVIAPGDVEDEGGVAFSIRAESLAALRADWVALHQRVGAPGPFHRPEWHETWLRHFGAAGDPVFLAVRHDEQLIGVIALDMGVGVASELGDPDLRDYAGPLAAEGFENDVVLALLDWVAEDMTPELRLWGMRATDPLVRLFEAEATDNGWDLSTEAEAVCPVARLPAQWDEYVASLSKHERHELRRKLRRLEQAGEVHYETLADPAEIQRELPTLFAMMRASHEGKAAFLSPEREAFFRDLAAALAPAGLMSLGVLRLDGRAAAMLYTFEDATGVYLYNSGFDPALSPLTVGLLSKALALRDAIARGKRRFDFLRGEEAYKRHLGGEPEQLLRLTFRRR